MKYTTSTHEVFRSDNDAELISGGIEDSPFAYEVLGKNIYTRPKEAPVRELCTNAHDSKGVKPFEVHAPTFEDPTFIVRDFGPGMSDEDVRRYALRYFASSKRNDEVAAGVFGLGMKSPIAYTDTYAITNYQNGEQRTQMIFRDERGVPQATPAEVVSSNEEGGMEIRFGVKRYDINEFREIISTILGRFPEGSFTPINFTPNFPEYKLKFDTWGITDKVDQMPMLRMGPVCYALDEDQISERLHDWRGVIFDVPMGSVMPHPSREFLNYDKNTIDIVKAAFASARKDIETYVEQELNKIENNWEGRRLVWALEQRLGKLWGVVNSSLRSKAQETYFFELYVEDQDLKRDLSDDEQVAQRQFIQNRKTFRLISVSNYAEGNKPKRYGLRRSAKDRRKDEMHQAYRSNGDHIGIVLADVNRRKGPEARLFMLCETLRCGIGKGNGGYHQLAVLDPSTWTIEQILNAVPGLKEEDIFRLSDVKISEIDEARKQKTGIAQAYIVGQYGLKVSHVSSLKGGIYVPVKGRKIDARIQAIASNLAVTVYALPERFCNEYDMSNFTLMDDYLDERIDAICERIPDIGHYIAISLGGISGHRSINKYIELMGDTLIDPVLIKIKTALQQSLLSQKYKEDIGFIVGLRNRGYENAKSIPVPEIVTGEELMNELRTKRPVFSLLLETINFYGFEEKLDILNMALEVKRDDDIMPVVENLFEEDEEEDV